MYRKGKKVSQINFPDRKSMEKHVLLENVQNFIQFTVHLIFFKVKRGKQDLANIILFQAFTKHFLQHHLSLQCKC